MKKQNTTNKFIRWFNNYYQLLIVCMLIVSDLMIADWIYSDSYFWRIFAILFSSVIIIYGIVNDQLHKDKNSLLSDKNKFKRMNLKNELITVVISGIILIAPTILIISLGGAKTSKLTLITFIYTVLLAPMIEEIIYRQQMFEALSRFGMVIAFVASCLMFTFIHFPQSLAMALYLLFRAAVLAIVYLLCNQRIYFSWSIHFLNNLVIAIFCIVNSGFTF